MFVFDNAFVLCFILVLVIQDSGSVSFVRDGNLNEGLQVHTVDGIVQGRLQKTFSGRSFQSFRGIPFARPPIGSLRFRAPKPTDSWKRVLDATRRGPTCMEIFLRSSGVFVSGSEDCLYINVFTPVDRRSKKKPLPVLVWFYGGAFMEGNSTEILFGPEYLMEEDIVLVTMNYRTGFFGFLSTEDAASPGNYGLKDQLLSLQWIQKNIASFGGDPQQVTISGQSAGAASVLYHMASPKSRGLFRGAIALSGSSLCSFARKRNAREIAFKIGYALGINTKNTKELVSKLRKVDLEKLNNVSKNLAILGMITMVQQGFPFGPVIEHRHKDAFISESTYALFENGNFTKVPLIMGTTSDEAVFFEKIITDVKPFTIVLDLSPGSIPNAAMNIDSFEKRREVGNEIRKHYFKTGSTFESSIPEILALINDDQFVRPLRKTAQLISRFSPVYSYVFKYRNKFGVRGFDDEIHDFPGGVAHTEDLSYIWKSVLRPPAVEPEVKRMISRMVTFWTNFIKTGNPTPKRDELFDNVIWPPVDSPDNIKYLNIDSKLSLRSNFREEHMRFWNHLYTKYGGGSYITY